MGFWLHEWLFSCICSGFGWPLFGFCPATDQATRRWHAELDDPKHPKDKIKSPDENGLPNGPLALQLHLPVLLLVPCK